MEEHTGTGENRPLLSPGHPASPPACRTTRTENDSPTGLLGMAEASGAVAALVLARRSNPGGSAPQPLLRALARQRSAFSTRQTQILYPFAA